MTLNDIQQWDFQIVETNQVWRLLAPLVVSVTVHNARFCDLNNFLRRLIFTSWSWFQRTVRLGCCRWLCLLILSQLLSGFNVKILIWTLDKREAAPLLELLLWNRFLLPDAWQWLLYVHIDLEIFKTSGDIADLEVCLRHLRWWLQRLTFLIVFNRRVLFDFLYKVQFLLHYLLTQEGWVRPLGFALAEHGDQVAQLRCFSLVL